MDAPKRVNEVIVCVCSYPGNSSMWALSHTLLFYVSLSSITSSLMKGVGMLLPARD